MRSDFQRIAIYPGRNAALSQLFQDGSLGEQREEKIRVNCQCGIQRIKRGGEIALKPQRDCLVELDLGVARLPLLEVV